MRVAHFFSGNPTSGAASGALNLCKGLIKENINIEIFNDQFDFNIKEKKIFYKKNNLKNFFSIIRNIKDRSSFLSYKKKIKFSNGTVGNLPISKDEINKFDILHLHWINNGFFNIEYLNQIKIPIVWTIRDMWPFTGGCHYTLECQKFINECSKCPLIKSYYQNKDIIKSLFYKKKRILSDKKIYIVPISKWLEKQSKKSLLLKDKNFVQIYNSIDNENFYYEDINESRKFLGLPKNKFIILFGSQNLDDELKDNSKIIEIYKKLNNEYFFMSFGNKTSKFNGIKNFGFIKDKKILRKIYSSANLFISFSKQEAFGKTLGEAILCNTPVVAKNNFSNLEIISNRENGFIVENDDYEEGIEWVRQNLDKNKKTFSLKLRNNFEIDYISKQYLELYKFVVNSFDYENKK